MSASSLWVQGYSRASDNLERLPGPMLGMLLPRLLASAPDSDDDPLYDAGYRASLRAALDR